MTPSHLISTRPLSCLVAIFLCVSLVSAQGNAQRPLDHKDYDVWKTMSRYSISNDGKWAVYSVQSGAIDGEATLHVHDTKTGREYVVERGSGAQLTHDSRFLVYRVTPDKKKLKQLRKDKTKESELPKPRVQVLELATGAVTTIDHVRSFKMPAENGDWLACLLEKPSDPDELKDKKPSSRETYEVTGEGLRRPEQPLKLKSREQLARERGELEPEPKETKESKETTKSKAPANDDEAKEKQKTAGTPLVLIHLNTGVSRTYPAAVSYGFSKNGKLLAFSTSVETDKDNDSEKDAKPSEQEKSNRPRDGVHVIRLDSLDRVTIAKGIGQYKNMTISDDGSHVAFITNKDDYKAETSTWALYLWNSRGKEAKRIATEGDEGIPVGWWVSPSSSQRFSEDGRRLYFDTCPVPDEVVEERDAKKEGREIKDEDQDEKAKLDIWHWKDPQLQPQQLLQAESERRRDYIAAYVIKSKKISQLATRQIPNVSVDVRSPADIAVANTNMQYRKMLSWDVPGFQDAYLVNLNSGKRDLVLEKVKWYATMSPDGKFITWFDGEQKKWFAKSTKNAAADRVEISKGIRHPLQDELHDTPNLPRSYGSAGWTTGDRAFLVYDRFDIWSLDPTGKSEPKCLTDGNGRQNEIRFRIRTLDREQRAIDPGKPIMLDAFNRETKASGYYSLTLADKKDKTKQTSLRPLIMLDESVSGIQKAKEASSVVFTRSTFRDCPDLWSSDLRFKKISRVSDINPQQDDYVWGTSELVHWKAADGDDLDGILLKPDGFDPSKKYPLMVYFYERNSDNLHRYYPPAPGRSIICHSFYVSRGYLVFIPDIPYKTGQPGPSAANSVIPGVQSLIAQGFVDEKRVGTQGHSWGGYQTAYLVTQTDMFACAESGAPVSNMTSAYGGIRWGSGMSRMFQYERTQSRIGEDLWSARDKYVANSPLFFADKVNTPLLILHNDEDGAVPWYQGIELFVALRRLEKPAWMLNYNGNPHWVMGDYNRRDFAIRMQQFFDHYLKDAPEPEWMAVGVPAVNKGENFGLELLEPEKKEAETN